MIHTQDFSFEFSGFYYTSNFLRILRILLQLKQLSYKPTPDKRSENSPFSRNLIAAERNRRGQGGVMWTQYYTRSYAIHIDWFNLIQSDQLISLSWGSWGKGKLHWYLHRSSSRPRPLWGLFLSRIEKTEDGGFLNPLHSREERTQ